MKYEISHSIHQVPEFEVTPRSVIFSNSKLNLNQPYSLSFTITNKSNSQQLLTVTPIPNYADMHITLEQSFQGMLLWS